MEKSQSHARSSYTLQMTDEQEVSFSSPFEFQAITYKIKKKSECKYILKDIYGRFYPGRMVAIIGPSGAGKTSLIKILSGVRGNGISGQVFLNGEKWSEDQHNNLICHICQDVSFFGELTVDETMMFAARLKIKQSHEHRPVVDRILNALHLTKCKETYVNNISGGELKRLSIGVELITNPPIMFMDEPTSGLDSFTSFQLMEHVKQLSQSRVVICVIHQPNSQLLELFDDIMVLANGQNLYSGPLDELVPYFAEAGITCPSFYNRADFVIEIAFKADQEKLNELALNTKKAYQNNPISTNKLTKDTYEDNIYENSNLITKLECLKTNEISSWKKFYILLNRSLKVTIRNKHTAPFQLGAHVCVGLIMGVLYYQIGKDASTMFSNWSNLFFAIIFIFIVNSFSSVITFPSESQIFLREHYNNWYGTTSYFFSKILTKFPLLLIAPTLFVLIVYFLTGQPCESSHLTKFYIVIILNAILGDMYGNFIGALFDIKIGILAAPSFFLPMLLFSGFFIRLADIPSFLQWLGDISFCRLGFEAIMLAIYAFRENIPCSALFCYFRKKEHFFKELGLKEDNFHNDICGLVLWIFTLLFGCLGVLFFRTYKYKRQ